MNIVLRFFMFVALAGFVASVVTHIAGYMGIERPFSFDPWPLHVGIFVVWLPAVLVSKRLAKDFPQKDMWKATLRGCPPWMKKALFALFGYAFLSFAMFMALGAASGNEAGTLRGFSGHWLVFYAAAYAILYSAIQVSENETARRCKKGHLLELADKYCRQCGDHVGSVVE